MNALTPIANKLGKLIRLLSSDRDGEVVSAARAISRTLDSEKLDIHALANVVEGAEAPTSLAEPSWHEIARECAAHRDQLRDYERDR